MGEYGSEYVVGETYRSSSDPEQDQFQQWLNGPIETGIRNSGGIRAIVNPDTGERELLVFVSDSSTAQNQNPWEDVINMDDGRARYWGDAKARHSPNPDTATGNKWVKTDFSRSYALNERDKAPPVLLFEKPESGAVTFRGVCILTDIHLKRHRDGGETVVNYLFDLAILDADTVSLEWIHRKARTGVDEEGPKAWQDWVSEGRVRRYSIWKKDVRTKQNQYPSDQYQQVLDDVRRRLDDPKKGQKLEHLVKFILEEHDNFQNVELTAKSGDKGVDLVGEINLLPATELRAANTTINFKAQVKNRGSSIAGEELSHLASRVDDGEIGLFFTTAHYTRSAQKENLSTYPVRLFAGRELVDLLVQTDFVEDFRLTEEVVADIEESVR